MRRISIATTLAAAASLMVAGAAAAQPIHEPASCAGYLASWANPNNGWIIQNLVRPAAAANGTNVGAIIVPNALEHDGSLEACIPE